MRSARVDRPSLGGSKEVEQPHAELLRRLERQQVPRVLDHVEPAARDRRGEGVGGIKEVSDLAAAHREQRG